MKVGSNFTASSSATDHTIMEQGVTPSNSDSEEDKAKTVKWYAQGYDKGSQHRDLRYGTMTLEKPLNIEKRDYLSFDVYAVGGDGDGVLSTNYLYLTLVDSNDKQMGCDANSQKSYLNTMLSGSVVMKNNQWVTVKLQLDKMPGYSDFDLTKLSKIRIGDDYERTVYFRNFVFTAKPVANKTVGFSVEQADIPDYGSAGSNILKPASGAIFTSSVAGSGTQAVDTDGTFDLQDGETVTFTPVPLWQLYLAARGGKHRLVRHPLGSVRERDVGQRSGDKSVCKRHNHHPAARRQHKPGGRQNRNGRHTINRQQLQRQQARRKYAGVPQLRRAGRRIPRIEGQVH